MLSGFAGLVEVLRSRAENAFYAPVLSVSAAGGKPSNPELVFVIHGRQLLGEFHIFLRALGLKPLEWSEARKRTGKPNPYTWEIVDLALKQAGAIVALVGHPRLEENVFKERLSFDAAESMKQWSIKDLLEDVDTLNIG